MMLDLSGVPDLCRRLHVRQLDLFGSAVDGRFDPGRSDLDFIVTFESDREGAAFRTYFRLLDELGRLFDRDIDLVEEGAAENPHFVAQMNRTRQRIYPQP